MTLSSKTSALPLVIAMSMAACTMSQDDTPADPPDQISSSATVAWTWGQSGIHGGGMGQVIATDPFHANFATLGGDSWGVYKTTSKGDDWTPATKMNSGDDGDFNYTGIAYSRKFPGRIYSLNGVVGRANGSFQQVVGNTSTVITRTVFGGEANADRHDRPRNTGNRVVVDYDAASGREYIYIATGSGNGVKRSTDEGKTWTTIGLSGRDIQMTGMALDPSGTALYVTSHLGSFRIDAIRGGSASTTPLGGPNRCEEIAEIGGTLYAACGTSGIYRVTARGATWTELGGSMFSTASAWSAVGGAGNTVYVGCANPDAGKSVAKSTDGGDTWTFVTPPTAVSIKIWGRTDTWWLAEAAPRIVLGQGTSEVASIAVDQFDPRIVYLAGRSGAWKSEDGGGHWRPAVNHLGGTMHNHVEALAGGGARTDDVDWTEETTSNYFGTAKIGSAPFSKRPTLNLTKAGHRYVITNSTPRDFLLDGNSIADEYFRAACVRAADIDVSPDGTHIYVAQFGGGVLVGHR